MIDYANCTGVSYKNKPIKQSTKNKLQKLTYTQTTKCNKLGLTHASVERFKRRAKSTIVWNVPILISLFLPGSLHQLRCITTKLIDSSDLV